MDFTPDYRHVVAAARNQRPARLPVYEHSISPTFMERVLDVRFASLAGGTAADRREFFRQYCRFFREMTYDTVSFEVCICGILPDSGAIMGGRPGPIQNRRDFEQYPWAEIPQRYWAVAGPQFEALIANLPPGMKGLAGVGNGVFEISEDLVGYQYLCYLQHDDPELFGDLYRRIGDLMVDLWGTFLQRYASAYAVCRIGDDFGFKTTTLLAPTTLRQHVIPQYRRLIGAIHAAGYPFLMHSCGNIFGVMDDLLAAGIDAKHSNEDVIAPFDEWIRRYHEHIGLFGGIDVDVLCRQHPDDVYAQVLDLGTRFRRSARGFALGSGNSIPDYVPVEGYLAMIRAAQELRRREAAGH